jgi:ppGpp synthetase/RelA/SpoT-type nucleotidyltranferase
VTEATFPGGSKSRVTRAGERIRQEIATADDLLVIEEWRAAHRGVLNTFQAILRNRTRGTKVSVAQRHKRKMTIFDKLKRLPGMQLARMDDVAGCRLIFRSTKDLYAFRSRFHKARFNHKLRNESDKYDYLKAPKLTGYRGIHDVYEYNVNSATGKTIAGLYIEIQYRTLVQHAWATAVEVIGFITQSQPKFQRGDTRYEQEMALASELLARAHEQQTGPFPAKSDQDVLDEFLSLDNEIHLMQTLRGLNSVKGDVTDKRNSILIFSKEGNLEVRSFRDATDALRALFTLEKDMPDQDIVLVHADTSAEVQLAFRNYFTDAREFVRLVDKACTQLSGRIVVQGRPVRDRRS